MRRPSRNAWLVIIALLVIVIPLGVGVLNIFVTHEVPFLRPEAGAQWIKMTEPVNLKSWKGTSVVDYRKQFILEKDFPDSVLTVKALRTAQVYLDGQIISAFSDKDDGKNARFVEMRGLTQGPHELGIAVKNETGPALLLAYCNSLGIFSGPGWESSLDGVNWLPATLAKERMTADFSLRFPSAMEAFRTLVPVYLPLFLISFFTALLFPSARNKYPWMGKAALSPSQIRWLLMTCWALLAVNNVSKIPFNIGFDASGHYAYILHILKNRTIPLATDGWQMFQSPLFYLLSAGLMKLLSPFFSATTVSYMLRIIPLLSGVLQVQMAYQAVRYVFPGRNDLQIGGTVIGGLLPMNLYLSQVLSNEPLAGVLSAAAIVIALGILTREGPLRKKKIIMWGVVAGLACLTKVTAVLLIPGLILVLIYTMSKKNESPRSVIRGLVMFLGAVVVVSGWYYLRNWIALGRPFVGGWEISRGIVWWQEPGYRTIQDFISFGRSLTHPLFSSLNGFWDSIYSTFWLDGLNSSVVSYKINPPWNYDFMLSSTLLALLPTAGIILGFIMSLRRPWTAHPGQFFAVYCISVYFAALLYLYVTVPIYSTAKATYTIGLVPCYAIACVTGLDMLTRTRYLRAAVYALFVCWAVSVYAAYFVV